VGPFPIGCSSRPPRGAPRPPIVEASVAQTPLTLQVSAAAAYDLGKPIALKLKFTRPATAAGSATISSFLMGSICVSSLTRDGVTVSPVQTELFTTDSLDALGGQSLKTLKPGKSLALMLNLREVPGGEGRLLVVGRADASGSQTAFMYPFTEVGQYTVTLCYRYAGPGGNKPNVVREEIQSNTISLRIR
jgi:hypothetical protein